MTIQAEDVKSLGTLDDLITELSTTEPLNSVEFSPNGDDKVYFSLPPGWNVGMKELPGTAMTECTMEIGSNSYGLTKDALLQATSIVGLQRDYVQRTPGNLIEPNLNYWMRNIPNKTFKLLTRNNEGLAFVKGTVIPISNLNLLDRAMDVIWQYYGTDTEVLVDYKKYHDLRRSDFRLIIPEKERILHTARSDSDRWSMGLDFANSLTAEQQTKIRGYLFSWWCTNGQTSTHATSGAFNRKGNISEEDAMMWAASAVDDILGGLEHEFDAVQELTTIKIEGEVNATMHDIFARYKVPVSAREDIIKELVESDDLSMFGVLSAITAAANTDGLKPTTISRLLEIGGDLPAAVTGRCQTCHRLPVT